jgi:hypothetical protein
MSDWTTKYYPVGSRYWVLPGTDYTIETTGYNTTTWKSGAEKGRRMGGGYCPRRGRQRLGSYPTLQMAKDRVARDIARRAEKEAA